MDIVKSGGLCDNRPVPDGSEFLGNPDFVLSLCRGLSVMEAFEDHRNGLTVGDIASRTGISRAAVRRLLITLELLGYATHDGSVYRLGSRVLRLGFSFLSSHSLPALAVPILEGISSAIHESSSLSVLEGDEIVYLARSATNRVMSVSLAVGSRLPAYCTSMGRVLLSALPDSELSVYLDRVVLRAHTSRTITEKPALASEIRKVREPGVLACGRRIGTGAEVARGAGCDPNWARSRCHEHRRPRLPGQHRPDDGSISPGIKGWRTLAGAGTGLTLTSFGRLSYK